MLVRDEPRAEQLGAIISALAPDCDVMVLPRWDAMPYDGIPPSREIAGRRTSVLRRISAQSHPLVLAAPEAMLQRVPPAGVWSNAARTLRSGDSLDLAGLRDFLTRSGYDLDSRVDEPGEVAFRGQVIDVFPAGALGPVRIEHDDRRILALSLYDPATQRTSGTLTTLTLDVASELLCAGPERALTTVFAYMPQARLIVDAGVEARAEAWRDQIREGHESRLGAPIRLRDAASADPDPDQLYLGEPAWREAVRRPGAVVLPEAGGKGLVVPRFVTAPNPTRAYRSFVAAELRQGRRVVLAAADPHDLRSLERRLPDGIERPVPLAPSWRALRSAQSISALQVDLEAGFVLTTAGVAVIAAADLLGSRAIHGMPMARPLSIAEPAPFRPGDAVVHLDRGVALLRGLEAVRTPDLPERDMLRLDYAGDTSVMIPVEEITLLWKYASRPDGVTLDRADGEAWLRRRAVLEREIAEAARGLVALVKRRESRHAPRLSPPTPAYERFAARFPFVLTPDQARAITDVLQDLGSGRPMDRLVCGDVGFGKTEVALRAAAATVLSGRQVALIAPTTVLARQHAATFRRRFAGITDKLGHLSRLTGAAEARAARAGLADGTLRIVIGTHALAGKDVRFRDLGLLIIDEEQRFGAREKAKLRTFGKGLHVLTLTATPIPRTLRMALIGLQPVSVIATPPVRRLPVRTVIAPFDAAAVSAALTQERRRGGQSFVVCPRIEDIAPMAERLKEIVPALTVITAHGRMPARAIDDAMVRFADGDGDILLTTDIIESGLDLPRANTILIWRPDHFGLAQLHQLRGRVGRGTRRGLACLLTDRAGMTTAAESRLGALAGNDRLGDGLAISQHDMELRGAGDLLGERQAGHVKLVGPELYRHLLERALAKARGEAAPAELAVDLRIGFAGRIPQRYVPEPDVRLELYARLARLHDAAAIEALAEEVEDRFGPPPPEVRDLLAVAHIRLDCHLLGVLRIDAGPQAIALTPAPGRAAALRRAARGTALRWSGHRLIAAGATGEDMRTSAIAALLEQLLDTAQDVRGRAGTSGGTAEGKPRGRPRATGTSDQRPGAGRRRRTRRLPGGGLCSPP